MSRWDKFVLILIVFAVLISLAGIIIEAVK
jgi:hypothetical protein